VEHLILLMHKRSVKGINSCQVIFFKFVLVVLIYLDRMVFPRFSRFRLCCQPRFERKKSRLSTIYALDCTFKTHSLFSFHKKFKNGVFQVTKIIQEGRDVMFTS